MSDMSTDLLASESYVFPKGSFILEMIAIEWMLVSLTNSYVET